VTTVTLEADFWSRSETTRPSSSRRPVARIHPRPIHHLDGHNVCRVHVEPSGHPVEAETTVADEQGRLAKKRLFYVRLNNATRSIEDERERQRFIAQRWGRA
jgi:hypothetical protein